MKNKKVVLLIIMLISFSFSNVFALEPVLCEISEEYRNWLNLSDEDKANLDEPEMCVKEEKKYNKELGKNFFKNVFDIVKETAFESTYSSVEKGYITPIKNQNPTGMCWIYSTNAILESYLLKNYNKTFDFSEAHVEFLSTRSGFSDGAINPNGYNRTFNQGGNYIYAATYLFNHLGSISESLMVTDNYKDQVVGTKSITFAEIPSVEPEIDVDSFEYVYSSEATSCSTSAIADIKELVIANGAVGISMYSDGKYYTTDGSKIYFSYDGSALDNNGNKITSTNHAITIVGWDDTISKSKFKNATRDGAWLVRNSWGTTWGDNGYFYISYDDIHACKAYYTFKANVNNIYDYTYRSNNLGQYTSIGYTPSSSYSSYVITQFKKQTEGNEYLKKVSLSVDQGVKYNVYYIANITDANVGGSLDNWQLLGTIDAKKNGVLSLKLTNEIKINGDYAIAYSYEGSNLFPASCKNNTVGDRNYYDSVDNSSNPDLSIARKSTYSIVLTGGNTIYQEVDLKDFNYSSIAGCTSSIYTYTYSKDFNGVTNVTNDQAKVYSNKTNSYTLTFDLSNYFADKTLNISVTDKDNKNYISSFSVEKDFKNGKLVLKLVKNIPEGDYKVNFSGYGVNYNKTIHFDALVSSADSKIVVDNANNLIYMDIFDTKKDYTNIGKIKNKITSDYTKSFRNKNNEIIYEDTEVVGTNYKMLFNGTEYKLILLGDTYADGVIDALDYIKIRSQIMSENGEYITNDIEKKAADFYADGVIDALDYIKVRTLIMSKEE